MKGMANEEQLIGGEEAVGVEGGGESRQNIHAELSFAKGVGVTGGGTGRRRRGVGEGRGGGRGGGGVH